MIVVDASVIVDVLLRTPMAASSERRLFEPGQTWHAPYLVDIEVAHVLRRHVANRALDEDRGRAVLADFADLPLRRYPHALLLSRVWDLRDNLTAYDAVYVALAEALGAPLITRDRRLAGAAGHRAGIELI